MAGTVRNAGSTLPPPQSPLGCRVGRSFFFFKLCAPARSHRRHVVAHTMARMNRGEVRYKRKRSCQSTTLLALLCGLAGEEDLCLLLSVYSLHRWSLYRQLVAPTTMEGICPNYDFFTVIGGFDFKELLRFEKPHFMQLLRRLELPEFIEIHRCAIRGIPNVTGGELLLLCPAACSLSQTEGCCTPCYKHVSCNVFMVV